MKNLLLFFGMNVVYGLEFDQFDSNDINSLREATRYYQQEYDKKRGTIEAEEDFDKFWQYYIKFTDTQNDKIKIVTPLFYTYYSNQAQEEYKEYYKYGLLAKFYDGQYFFDTSNRYLYENFALYLTKPHQDC